MKLSRKNKVICSKCNMKSSIMTVHTPTFKGETDKIHLEPKIDFIEKMYCLKCGREVK